MVEQSRRGGGGCVMLGVAILGVLLAVLGLIIVILVAPAPPVQSALTSVDNVRFLLGGEAVGGPSDLGYDPTCPMNTPFRCDNGTCVLTPSQCDPENQCPPDMPFLCVDGSCSAVPNQCVEHPDCPAVTPYQCPTGGCAPSPSECGDDLPVSAGCPAGAVTCADGSCALDEGGCPGTPDEHQRAVEYFEANFSADLMASIDPGLLAEAQRQADASPTDDLVDPAVESCWDPHTGGSCHFGGTCCCNICIYWPGQGDFCTSSICMYIPSPFPIPPAPAACPEDAPILCADGSCVATQADCSLPDDVSAPDVPSCPAEAPIMCRDGSCVRTAEDCPSSEPPDDVSGGETGCAVDQFQCPDGSCVATRADCPTPPTEAPATCSPDQFQCADGSCVATRSDCP